MAKPHTTSKKRQAKQQNWSPKAFFAPLKPFPSRHPVLLTLIIIIIAAFAWFVVKPFVSYRLAESKAHAVLASIPLSGDHQVYASAEDIGCGSHDLGWFGRTTDCGFSVTKIVALKGDKAKLSQILHTLNTRLYEMGWEGYLSSGNIKSHSDFINGDSNNATYHPKPPADRFFTNDNPTLNVDVLKLPASIYDYHSFSGLYEDPMPNLEGYDYVVFVGGVVFY